MVHARTVQEAIKKSGKAPVLGVFLDDDWKKNMLVVEQFPPQSQSGFVARRKKTK